MHAKANSHSATGVTTKASYKLDNKEGVGKGCSEDLVSYQDRQGERLKRTGHDLAGGKGGMGAAEQERENKTPSSQTKD